MAKRMNKRFSLSSLKTFKSSFSKSSDVMLKSSPAILQSFNLELFEHYELPIISPEPYCINFDDVLFKTNYNQVLLELKSKDVTDNFLNNKRLIINMMLQNKIILDNFNSSFPSAPPYSPDFSSLDTLFEPEE